MIENKNCENFNTIVEYALGMPITHDENEEFKRIKSLVARDEFLSEGYRKPKKISPALVRNMKRYPPVPPIEQDEKKKIYRPVSILWTERNCDILRRRYPNGDIKELANFFGTSVGAVYTQALKLKLRRDKAVSSAKKSQVMKQLWNVKRANTNGNVSSTK